MQPSHTEIGAEKAALAAVYRLLRELGQRRLACRADADEPLTALFRPAREIQDESAPRDNGSGDETDG